MAEQDNYQQNEAQHRVLPAYEHVKLNIIFYWFTIQTEFQKYIFIQTHGKASNIKSISSKILSLYLTMLKSMMIRRKKTELIAKIDVYVKNGYTIPEEDIVGIVTDFESFLYEIGFLNTLYESKPWEDQFSNEYPV